MPTIYDDSFQVYGNTYKTVNPDNQGDSFGIYSNIFQNIAPINQGDSFLVGGNTSLSFQTNTYSFTYIITQITDIIPDPAPMPGGVTIIGTLLDKVTAVYMDGKQALFRIVSDTEIRATIPFNVSSTTIEVYVQYE